MASEPVAKRRGIATNSFFSIIAWTFPILLGFISTPILVRALGSEQYGLFAIVLGFISYSFTFGVGKVVGKYVPEYQASGETEKTTQVISATFWFSLLVGAAGAATLILTAPYIVRSLLLITPERQEAAIHSLYLAGAVGVAFMLSQVFQFVLQGLHRFDNYVTITNLNGLLLGAGNIVLALNGFGVAGLLVWNLAVVLFTGVLFFARAKRFLPSINLLRNAPRSIWVSVVRYAGNIILFQIFANALLIFERSWVMRKFGAAALTFYFVPMLLAIYMHGFVASVVQPVFSVANEIIEDRDRIAELYRRANKLILAIVAFTVTNFIVCGMLFLKLWVSAELAGASYTLLVFHGATFGLIAMAIMTFQLAEVFKFPALNVIMTGSWMLIAIPLMIVAADPWRSEGVAAARLIAALVTLPIVAYTEHRFLGAIQWRFWFAVGIRVGAASVAMGAAEWLVLRMLGDSYLALFGAGTAGAIVFAAILAIAGFLTADERDMIRRRLGARRVAIGGGGTME